jgi:lipid A 4'-phosphatase
MAALRRGWHSDAILLFAIAVAVTVTFAVTRLDIATARIFYRPQSTEHWPLGTLWPSSVLYQLAPYITASLLVLGVFWLIVGQLRRRLTWRERGVFLILCVIIGPGLLINVIFKDHWDRPRPRDVVEFGGVEHYTPAPWPGEGGSSFPCGHCSVGFLYASGWWVWRRRHPKLARASLALGLTLGSTLGLGRMAAGAHFFSDVIWSALLALGVACALSHAILHWSESDAAVPRIFMRWLDGRPQSRCMAVLALLGATFALIALFVTPHGKPFSTQIDLATLPRPPRVLEISASSANIDVVVGDYRDTMRVDGELHGFGLPGSRLDVSASFHVEPIPTLAYRIEEQGWITDLSAVATIRVPLGELERIAVHLHHGNIHVIDATSNGEVRNGTLQLDLRTDSGMVQKPGDAAR